MNEHRFQFTFMASKKNFTISFRAKTFVIKRIKGVRKNQREKFTRDKKSPTLENMKARVIKINEVKSQISKYLKTLPTSKLTIISHSRSVD